MRYCAGKCRVLHCHCAKIVPDLVVVLCHRSIHHSITAGRIQSPSLNLLFAARLLPKNFPHIFDVSQKCQQLLLRLHLFFVGIVIPHRSYHSVQILGFF